jgi:pimeloyl-ACP methyl ester carboxylesterase
MTGAARQLICLGGTLCDERVFAPLLERLPRPASIWSHTQYNRVSDAAAALVTGAPTAFIALGFSLGGFVALEALRIAQHKVATVILLSGNAFPDSPENTYARRNDVTSGREMGLRAFIEARGQALVSPSCETFEHVVGLIADMAEGQGDEVHARQAEMNIDRPDLRAAVHASTRPILAIAGADDNICPQERYLDLQNAPNVTLKLIDGAGHFLPLEAPHACADAIAIFMKEHNL